MARKSTTHRSVKVPPEIRAVFEKAQESVWAYFKDQARDPRRGQLTFSGERYLMIRAASLSQEFFQLVASLRQNLGQRQAYQVAASFLFDLSHSLGKNDARHFHAKMGLTNPLEKLSAGPPHFAHTGWAFVDIDPRSHPTPDQDYLLVYEHRHSFEADAWLSRGAAVPFPVCVMNAGYSSGWCAESFDLGLTAVEIECRAKGDERCLFVMAPPARLEQRIAEIGGARAGGALERLGFNLSTYLQSEHLRSELQKERNFSATVLDNINALVLVVDPAGRVVHINRACEQVSGFSAADLLGKVVWDCLPDPEAREQVQLLFGQVVRGELPTSFESNWTNRHGQRPSVQWTLTALRGGAGSLEYLVATGTDLTLRAQLEAKTQEQLVALERTNQRLQQVNAELDAFAYSVSHDLRTPLRAMEGFASALLNNYSKGLEPTGKEFARRIVDSASRMDVLITDLLAYSRLSLEEIRLEPTELQPVLQEALSRLETRIRESRATVHLEGPFPAVTGQRTTLLQLFENLLSNAIKYVAAGTRPVVRVHAVRGAEWVRLWIDDNGIGIAPENHERIFRALERLHGVDNYPGTGIGLALVRKGVERLGGRAGVESALGAGSRFWIDLRPAPAEPATT